LFASHAGKIPQFAYARAELDLESGHISSMESSSIKENDL